MNYMAIEILPSGLWITKEWAKDAMFIADYADEIIWLIDKEYKHYLVSIGEDINGL